VFVVPRFIPIFFALTAFNDNYVAFGSHNFVKSTVHIGTPKIVEKFKH